MPACTRAAAGEAVPAAAARSWPCIPSRQQVTIKHEDIAGFMPAMTMSFPVATPELMTGRAPGDLVTATLEVTRRARPADGDHARRARRRCRRHQRSAMLGVTCSSVGDEVPDAAFIDQSDRRRSLAEWRGIADARSRSSTRAARCRLSAR